MESYAPALERCLIHDVLVAVACAGTVTGKLTDEQLATAIQMRKERYSWEKIARLLKYSGDSGIFRRQIRAEQRRLGLKEIGE